MLFASILTEPPHPVCSHTGSVRLPFCVGIAQVELTAPIVSAAGFMGGVGGYAGWRWIFIVSFPLLADSSCASTALLTEGHFDELLTEVHRLQLEGLMTLVAGIGSFWAISDYPADCKWLTKEEADWLIYRKAIDSGVHGESEVVSWKYVRQALTDWQTYL